MFNPSPNSLIQIAATHYSYIVVGSNNRFPRHVYIQDVEGRLWRHEDWDGSVKPNAVAVITDKCKFLVALTDASPSVKSMNCEHYHMDEKAFELISEADDAKLDYDGLSNTEKFVKLKSSNDYAAGWCRHFMLPDGITRCYLPSLGELNTVYQHMSAVSSALSACGGKPLNMDRYWSSTMCCIDSCDMHRCWSMHMESGFAQFCTLNYCHYVRPFAALDDSVLMQEPYNPSEQMAVAKLSARNIEDGIYIEDFYGELYKADNWNVNKTPNCIVVISPEHRFRIALKNLGKNEISYHVYSTEKRWKLKMSAYHDDFFAVNDFHGFDNTYNIMQVIGDKDTAAHRCNAYWLPNKRARGYLPSCGELKLMYRYRKEINEALAACGGHPIESCVHWSSTFNNVGSDGYASFWTVGMSNGSFNCCTVNDKNMVRPVAVY